MEMKVKIIALLLSLVVLSQCQQPPSPNDEQLECFNETTTIEVNEFHRVCGDVLFGPPLTDVRGVAKPFGLRIHSVPLLFSLMISVTPETAFSSSTGYIVTVAMMA